MRQLVALRPIANRVLARSARLCMFPTARCITKPRHVGHTVKNVRRRLRRQLTRLRQNGRRLRTRHLQVHARCSIRVVRRINFYGNVRGCSQRVSNHTPKSTPGYLVSCFPRSFLLIVSRSRIAIPRVNNVCRNSVDHGHGLIRRNFQLPDTVSGHPLH